MELSDDFNSSWHCWPGVAVDEEAIPTTTEYRPLRWMVSRLCDCCAAWPEPVTSIPASGSLRTVASTCWEPEASEAGYSHSDAVAPGLIRIAMSISTSVWAAPFPGKAEETAAEDPSGRAESAAAGSMRNARVAVPRAVAALTFAGSDRIMKASSPANITGRFTWTFRLS